MRQGIISKEEHAMTRCPPMTAEKAREVVAIMQRETPKNARVKLMQIAIKMGNLSDDAKNVYRAALAQDTA